MNVKKAMVWTCAIAALSCTQERQTPTGDSGWIAQVMDTPEYAKACSQTPGCAELQEPLPEATESLWRIRVVRQVSGDLRIEQVDMIDVPEGEGVPIGRLFGSHIVVGLDRAGDTLDGQLIRFPDVLRIEYGDDALAESIDLTGKEVDAIAYLRISPSIVSLAVRDVSGKTVHAIEAPVRKGPDLPDAVGRLWGVSSAWAATRPFQGLPPHCAHVVVLQGEQDRDLAANITFEDTVTIARPGPFQLAAAQSALGRMTPMLCQSIGRIAFGYAPERKSISGAVNSFGAGDMIMINLASVQRFDEATLEERQSSRIFLQRTIIHEAAHAAETLLTVESSADHGSYEGAWGFPPRSLARKTIDRVRLEKGLPAEWQRLHGSFVVQEWAEAYGIGLLGSIPGASERYEEYKEQWSQSQVAAAGFMSNYGARNWAEDIATFVEYAYMSQTMATSYREHGVADTLREDAGCLEAQRYGEKNLPARFAALYTKLHFLKDLGLVKPEDLRACLGEHLGLPIDGPGFHVWQDTMRLRSFQNQLAAGIGTLDSGVPVFEMEATGEAGFADKTYPARVKLRLDLGSRFNEFSDVSWPRGAYKLGLLGNDNFTIRLDGAPAGNFDAMDGFVLVAESSSERIAGSIVLQRVFRLHAPLPVPEKYDPPLNIRFLMEK